MHPFEQQLKNINEKIQLLVKKYEALQKENEKLKLDLQQSNNRHQTLIEQSEKLEQQTEILKLSKGEMNAVEKKAFEKRLNQYVKEIDRCIALLSE
jgi:chromosome segregation ATPase